VLGTSLIRVVARRAADGQRVAPASGPVCTVTAAEAEGPVAPSLSVAVTWDAVGTRCGVDVGPPATPGAVCRRFGRWSATAVAVAPVDGVGPKPTAWSIGDASVAETVKVARLAGDRHFARSGDGPAVGRHVVGPGPTVLAGGRGPHPCQ